MSPSIVLEPPVKTSLAAYAKKCAALAAALQPPLPTPANTVVVQPGGKSYTSISAAIGNTIANEQVQAMLYVGPGTYNERVILKPYMHIQGSGADQTTITYPASINGDIDGTVVAASNSSITGCNVVSPATRGYTFMCALECNGAAPFTAGNCKFTGTDSGIEKNNVNCIVIDFPNAGSSDVYLNYCIVQGVSTAFPTSPFSLMVYGNAHVEVLECKIITPTPPSGFAWSVIGAQNATIELFDSDIEAATWALYAQDAAKVIATSCRIVGPVGPGVIVK